MVLKLAADLVGQTLGSLLDPILWVLMVAVAFRFPMRWIAPAALVVAVLVEVALYALESPDLRTTRFSMYTLIGRTFAGALIGAGMRALVTRHTRRRNLRVA